MLAMLTDAELRDELDRVAAAIGVRVVHAGGSAVSRKTWSAATAVVLDAAAADRCGRAVLPRRAHVSVLTAAEPTTATWMAAITVGLGLACFIGLLLVQVWLEVVMSPHQIWQALSGEDAHAGD